MRYNITHYSMITLKHDIRIWWVSATCFARHEGVSGSPLSPCLFSQFLSRLILEPLPFPHHVLVMSCEAIFRAKAWSWGAWRGGRCDEGLDGRVLYSMHWSGKNDRKPPGEGDREGEQRGVWHAHGPHRLQQAALDTEALNLITCL